VAPIKISFSQNSGLRLDRTGPYTVVHAHLILSDLFSRNTVIEYLPICQAIEENNWQLKLIKIPPELPDEGIKF
jgi:hypothetical protein